MQARFAPQNQYYINLEGTGVMPPDQILHSGIKVLQQKLATLIQELSGVDHNMQNSNMAGGQSPDMMDMAGQGTAYGGNTSYGGEGYATPFGGAGAGAGASSAWGGGQAGAAPGGGSTTPFGATPYGRSGNW